MAPSSDAADRLRSVDRFSSLSDADLKKLGRAGKVVHLPAQWSLMSETTPADKAYVLLTGEVAIRKGGETIATVGPGAVIGEVGILEKRLRTAAVVSQTELEVVHFTKEDLVKLVDEIPALKDALQSTASETPEDD
jgi:CRP/FNR family transcriptional regulator, cyclic AMP receptor protein